MSLTDARRAASGLAERRRSYLAASVSAAAGRTSDQTRKLEADSPFLDSAANGNRGPGSGGPGISWPGAHWHVALPWRTRRRAASPAALGTAEDIGAVLTGIEAGARSVARPASAAPAGTGRERRGPGEPGTRSLARAQFWVGRSPWGGRSRRGVCYHVAMTRQSTRLVTKPHSSGRRMRLAGSLIGLAGSSGPTRRLSPIRCLQWSM